MKLPITLAALALAASHLVAQTVASEAVTSIQAASDSALPVQSTTMLQLIKSGGWAMFPLGFLSILTATLVLAFLFSLRRGAVVSSHFMNTADVLLKKRDYLGLLAIASRHSEAIARVTQRTLDFASKNPSADLTVLREIAETEGSAQAAAMQSRITYLADIAVLSPMLGLLGTVSGLINSFGALASKGSQDRNILLAEGVSEALVATATGLILGIVAMGFYAVFRGRVQSLISDLETASTHIVGLIAVIHRKPEETPATARTTTKFGVTREF